jgi:hypothetical protein
MNETAILKAVLIEILDDDIGVYPKAFTGKYEKRTEYMEGWNAAVIEQCKHIIQIFDDYGVSVMDHVEVIDPKKSFKEN